MNENTNENLNENISDSMSENASEETNQNKNDEKTEKGNSVRNLLDWLETFAYAFCFVLVVFTFLFRVVTVDGSSMSPTLTGEEKYLNQSGDKLLISNVFYEPKYGDIVVVNREDDKPIIKRVIATEGQTVDIDFDTWTVTVDGKELSEDYINRIDGVPMLERDVSFPLTVEDDCIFVMGDNRNNSLDSRDSRIGQVKKENVVGRVLIRLLPISDFGKVEPREETVAAYERAMNEKEINELLNSDETEYGDNEVEYDF